MGEVRAISRVSLCCCSSILFTGLCWIVHRLQPCVSRTGEVPLHGCALGPSTFRVIHVRLLLLIYLLYFFPSMLEQKHHAPFWLKFWHTVSCFHQSETHQGLAMTCLGQFMGSSCTGHPYTSLTPKPCSVHSVHPKVWLSKQFKWLLVNSYDCFPRIFKIWFIYIVYTF